MFIKTQSGKDVVPRYFCLAAAEVGPHSDAVRAQSVVTGGGAPLCAGVSEVRDVANHADDGRCRLL